jgi:predicted hydrocarbon binding protein
MRIDFTIFIKGIAIPFTVEFKGGKNMQNSSQVKKIVSYNPGVFIYFPGEAIKSLRMELSNLLGEKLAAGALFRFGYRCGEAFFEQVAQGQESQGDLNDILYKIWGETGLGNIANVEEIAEDEVIVEQENSTEARIQGQADTPSCDFTRGYLAGIANTLTKNRYYCVETACISEGKERCTFRLILFPHKVYVTKNTS